MARKSRRQKAAAAPSAPLPQTWSAAGYVRLSADDRRKPGDSIATQKAIIRQFVESNPDIRLQDYYTDNAVSGTGFDRPAFQRMLEDAESGVINCIICKDLSRFGRNAIDAGFYIERRLPALGVRFIALGDHFDSNERDGAGNPCGGMTVVLKNIVNEAYALDISRKCRAVHRQNMLDGKFVGRTAPYGYIKDPDDCHKLIMDDAAAPIVQRIFALAKRGYSPYAIARLFNDEGLPTPSLDKRQREIVVDDTRIARHWCRSTLLDIFTDRVYVGDMVQGKTKTTRRGQENLPPEQWVTVENTHQPIISRELFDAVQAALERTGKEAAAKRSPTESYTPSLFVGKVFCGHCGRAMHRKRQNSDGVYWFRCESQNKYSKGACVQVSIKEKILREGASTMLRGYAKVLLGRKLRLCRHKMDGEDFEQRRKTELAEISRETGRNRAYLKSLTDRLLLGEIDTAQFSERKQVYSHRMEALTQRTVELESSARQLDGMIRDCQELAGCLANSRCKYDLTGELLEQLVERILVYHDKSFEIVWKFAQPFGQQEVVERWAM